MNYLEVLFSFQIPGDFPIDYYIIIFSLLLLFCEFVLIVCMIPIFQTSLRHVLWFRIWFIQANVICTLKEYVCSAIVEWNVLWISTRFMALILLFHSSLYLLVFSIKDSLVLKYLPFYICISCFFSLWLITFLKVIWNSVSRHIYIRFPFFLFLPPSPPSSLVLD